MKTGGSSAIRSTMGWRGSGWALDRRACSAMPLSSPSCARPIGGSRRSRRHRPPTPRSCGSPRRIEGLRDECAPPPRKESSPLSSRATATAAWARWPGSTRRRRRSAWSGSTPTRTSIPPTGVLGSSTGWAWRSSPENGWELLRATIPGFLPVAERDVVLVGVRDFEPHQRAPLKGSGLRVLAGSSFAPAELAGVLDRLRRRINRVYLHIDLDALDPSEGRANRYAAEGGLSLLQLEEAIDLVFGSSKLPRRRSPRTTPRWTRTDAWPEAPVG